MCRQCKIRSLKGGHLPWRKSKKFLLTTNNSSRKSATSSTVPAALGLKNGDVKMIKNAGGVVTSPFGSVIRSLLVAIIELGVTDIMVIGHTDCGVQHIDSEMMIHHMKERGITQESIDLMKYCGIDFEKWLSGFDTVEDSVRETVDTIRNHPLIPNDINIFGYVIDTQTGELYPVCGPALD